MWRAHTHSQQPSPHYPSTPTPTPPHTQPRQAFPELELSPLVQAAALMGVGLLYEGSGHRMMAETMVEEIGRR